MDRTKKLACVNRLILATWNIGIRAKARVIDTIMRLRETKRIGERNSESVNTI